MKKIRKVLTKKIKSSTWKEIKTFIQKQDLKFISFSCTIYEDKNGEQFIGLGNEYLSDKHRLEGD